MRFLVLFALLPACTLYSSGDDCVTPPAQNVAPEEQRNPTTLQCESYGQTCDPACGAPCPLTAGPPQPSWGLCNTACETHSEGDCAADPACRIVEDARCAVGLNCITNFLGCFSIDMAPDTSIDCVTADAWSCSRSNECTALHSTQSCPSGTQCDRPFELCIQEGGTPGRCYAPVTCDKAPPSCPTGTTPGVSAGCYTGACIPTHLCV